MHCLDDGANTKKVEVTQSDLHLKPSVGSNQQHRSATAHQRPIRSRSLLSTRGTGMPLEHRRPIRSRSLLSTSSTEMPLEHRRPIRSRSSLSTS